MNSGNVASTLWQAAGRWPDQPAVIHAASGASLSFAELCAQAGAVAAGLRALGVEPGQRVLVMLRPGLEFFAAMFGVAACGATAVLADPGMGLAAMLRCLKTIEPVAIIAESIFHLVSQLHQTFARGTVRISRGWYPTAISWPKFLATAAAPLPPASCSADDVAVLAFTSGATGLPKPVVMDHRTLSAQVEALRAISGIGEGDVQLAFIPLTGLLGGGLGCTTVIPSVDARRLQTLNAATTIAQMQRHAVTHCFASPFVWARLADELERHDTQLSLRRIFVGGAPPSPALVQRLVKCIAGEVHVSYGATEAVPVASATAEEFLAAHQGPHLGGCMVGRPVPGIEVSVACFEPEALRMAQTYEIGELLVRGPIVSPGYHGARRVDHLVQLAGSNWHRIGDAGYFDPLGRLVLCGRIADQVHGGGRVLHSLLVESQCRDVAGVSEVALVGVGQAPHQRAVLVVVASGERPTDEITAALNALAAAQGWQEMLADVLYRGALPTDTRHRSKILRAQLARWAEGKTRRKMPLSAP
ncbi:MAG: AMP-binding protein [Bradymonadaceae bacterium]|nr:AMP-binding protein [Lujinxingiaceae bacterium]